MEIEQLQQILSQFGLTFREITAFHDTSLGDEDRRLNYILDNTYVLKINSQKSMWEERLRGIARLIDRYGSIGIYAPKLLRTLTGDYSVTSDMDGVKYTCFVEEFAKYPVCDEETGLEYEEVIPHLGKLAAAYSGVDLTEIYSMWSLFDLSPFDEGVDEKQENAASLVEALKENGEVELAAQVRDFNEAQRQAILPGFQELPRCVFQGDMNRTNLLHQDGRFAGLIDFNMSGTDVNINVFACETNMFPQEMEFDAMTVPEILDLLKTGQDQLLDLIWASYEMNALEKKMLPHFRKLCDLFQWPNVCSLRKWMQEEERRDKALALIRELIKENRYERN